jgi:hypothetical protein
MTHDPTAARRARLARAAAAAAGRVAGVLAKTSGAPAAPGDLFVLRETAGLAVEWLVVERDPADRERLYVVPADTNPLLGGNDWAIAGDPATGPLSLRCGFGLWLPAGRLAPELRVGSISPDDMARTARWCGAMRETGADGAGEARAGLAGAAATWSTAGGDPDYEDWLDDVIAPARAAVAAAAVVAAAIGRPPRMPAQRQRRRRLYWLALAASLLLALALGLGLDGALRRETSLANRLRAEREALRGELRRSAPPAVAALPAPAASPQENAVDGDVLLNPPLVALQSEVMRGQGEKVRLDPAPRRLVLLAAEPRRGSSFPEYRLEILDRRTGRRVWSGGGLHLDPSSGLVMIAIRQRLLPAGLYEIHLDGLRAGSAARAGSYALEVEIGAPAGPPP